MLGGKTFEENVRIRNGNSNAVINRFGTMQSV